MGGLDRNLRLVQTNEAAWVSCLNSTVSYSTVRAFVLDAEITPKRGSHLPCGLFALPEAYRSSCFGK